MLCSGELNIVACRDCKSHSQQAFRANACNNTKYACVCGHEGVVVLVVVAVVVVMVVIDGACVARHYTVRSVAWSPDSARVVAGGCDGSVVLL